MQKKKKNYAFIDSQNLNLGITSLGWKLDFRKFKVYLKEKYNVSKAYLFIGYMPENQGLYKSLQEYGFVLVFKPVLKDKNGEVKGNVDADLVLQAMVDYEKYDKAVLVTSDGDFYSLARYLYDNKKLLAVLSPHRKTCSSLLRKSARDKMAYLDTMKEKLAKRKSTV